MITLTAYLKNGAMLDTMMEEIEELFPCFTQREFCEMDFSKITIKCLQEDGAMINRKLIAVALLQ